MARRSVVPSKAAGSDLVDAKRWLLQQGSGEAAKERLAHIRKAIRDLRREPCLWAEGDHPGVREIPVEGYTVMYDVNPDTNNNATAGNVRILRVFGPGMDRSQFRRSVR